MRLRTSAEKDKKIVLDEMSNFKIKSGRRHILEGNKEGKNYR